jgi:hypothetical protein
VSNTHEYGENGKPTTMIELFFIKNRQRPLCDPLASKSQILKHLFSFLKFENRQQFPAEIYNVNRSIVIV